VAAACTGQFDAASQALAGVARRVGEYAGSDPAMLGVAAELDQEAATFAAPMPEMSLKEVHYAASNTMRARTADGKAVKRPGA